VTSAATVMSSRSTILSDADQDIPDIPDYMSDFGDWFHSESRVKTLQWIYSDVREQPLFDFSTSTASSATVPTLPTESVTQDPISGGSSDVTEDTTDGPKAFEVVSSTEMEQEELSSTPSQSKSPPTYISYPLAQAASTSQVSQKSSHSFANLSVNFREQPLSDFSTGTTSSAPVPTLPTERATQTSTSGGSSTVTEEKTSDSKTSEVCSSAEMKQEELSPTPSRSKSPPTTFSDSLAQPASTNEVSQKGRHRFSNVSNSNILRVT
jgi:hypothetical protein